jgi:Zn-dependent peptidase ImmA (M78 family)
MSQRDDLLTAARRASEVISDSGARRRIDAGYTRINPEEIAAQVDVMVLYRKLDRLLGGFLREDGIAGVIVNVDRPRGLVHMTCAHEMGHFFLGHESTTDDTVEHGTDAQLIEQQANHFAYSLLAPQWLVATTMRRKGWTRSSLLIPDVMYQLSLRLGMSYTATVWSLTRIGVLPVVEATRLSAVQPRTLKRELLGGAAPQDANKDVWLLDASDRDRILEPAVGDQFVVDLPSHADSGYLWSIDTARSEGFSLEPFVHDARVAGTNPKGAVRVGGGSTMRYVLISNAQASEAHAAGGGSTETRRSNVRMHEVPPWDAQSRPLDELALDAEFVHLDDGYSSAEREHRLAQVREWR